MQTAGSLFQLGHRFGSAWDGVIIAGKRHGPPRLADPRACSSISNGTHCSIQTISCLPDGSYILLCRDLMSVLCYLPSPPRCGAGRPFNSDDPLNNRPQQLSQPSGDDTSVRPSARLHYGMEWAVLAFDRPLLCLPGSVMISTKFDLDLEHAGTTCRIAFYGNVARILQDPAEQQKLNLFRVPFPLPTTVSKQCRPVVCQAARDFCLCGCSTFSQAPWNSSRSSAPLLCRCSRREAAWPLFYPAACLACHFAAPAPQQLPASPANMFDRSVGCRLLLNG